MLTSIITTEFTDLRPKLYCINTIKLCLHDLPTLSSGLALESLARGLPPLEDNLPPSSEPVDSVEDNLASSLDSVDYIYTTKNIFQTINFLI